MRRFPFTAGQVLQNKERKHLKFLIDSFFWGPYGGGSFFYRLLYVKFFEIMLGFSMTKYPRASSETI